MNVTPARLVIALVAALLASGCATSATGSPSPSASNAAPSAMASSATGLGSTVIVGRIATMDEPPIAEALLIEDGSVRAIGDRKDVLALASDQVPIVDIGQSVAYPGFIDAHAHWIGDREYYGLETPAEAMQAALERGWTSISEQWVNQERLAELEALAADDALPLRVDAYLTLNEPHIGGRHFGDWYADREPGAVTDRLRVRGLKIHLDTGFELDLLWEPDELTSTVAAANAAGWQVAIHAFSDEAAEMALDAFEAALGPTGPNPLHHRIEHAVQVTDDQLARMVAMGIAVVIHLDTAVADWLGGPDTLSVMGGETAWLARWRDFVEAGLHAAGATDMPWILPDFKLTDDIGRPVDQIAGAMDPIGRVNPEPPEWMAYQLLSAEQGLRAVTVDAAYALGDELRRGHLAPGTLGDVTILSGDVTTATPDEIRAMTVVATIVGGIPAYCADPDICPQSDR
jgi:predicted amidohydrolase YtcJ